MAFSHLRNATPTITADTDGNGWRLSGRQPWCTGWGLIDTVLVGAVTDEDQVLLALVPAAEGQGMMPTDELDLAAMGGTHTVELELDGVFVAPSDVVMLAPRQEWTAGDAMRASNVQPSAVGVAQAALNALRSRDPEPAALLGSNLDDLRTRAYRSPTSPQRPTTWPSVIA